MKKMMILMLLALSFSVAAGPEHKNHKSKSEILNLTEEQKTAWKALKEEKNVAMKAAKKEIYADYDDRLAQILDEEQLAKYQEMRKHKKEHMAMKKHKKKKMKRKYKEKSED